MSNLSAWFWVVGIVLNFYEAFAVQHLWNWFAVPAFNIQAVSYWPVYGLLLIVELIRNPPSNPVEEMRWELTAVALDMCVPEGKMSDLKEIIRGQISSLINSFTLKTLGAAQA